jgi:hypothetical protein
MYKKFYHIFDKTFTKIQYFFSLTHFFSTKMKKVQRFIIYTNIKKNIKIENVYI